MVFTTIFPSKVRSNQEFIDVREAFNLWEILRSKYTIIEMLETFGPFIHDKDLKYYINKYVSQLQENKMLLEGELSKFGIQGSDQGRLPTNWAGNSEPFRDEMIALELVIYVQEHIENMLRASRTSTTNDHIRQLITAMLKDTIHRSETLFKYIKLKNWLATPPIYPNIPSNEAEKITCGTAAHLWDHLTVRYDNIHETKLFMALAYDIDFKLLLEQGLRKLLHQTELLEKECKRFGITMPKRPPEIVSAPELTEMFKDDHMYRRVLNGLQGMGMMHADAIKQCTLNDRIRGLFVKMFLQEIDFYDSFIKYGKLKGWLHPVPDYRA